MTSATKRKTKCSSNETVNELSFSNKRRKRSTSAKMGGKDVRLRDVQLHVKLNDGDWLVKSGLKDKRGKDECCCKMCSAFPEAATKGRSTFARGQKANAWCLPAVGVACRNDRALKHRNSAGHKAAKAACEKKESADEVAAAVRKVKETETVRSSDADEVPAVTQAQHQNET